MRPALLFLLASTALAAPPDQGLCSYWLQKLEQIGAIERQRAEVVPEIERTEGYYSATDYDIELRARILKLMKQIEKEGK